MLLRQPDCVFRAGSVINYHSKSFISRKVAGFQRKISFVNRNSCLIRFQLFIFYPFRAGIAKTFLFIFLVFGIPAFEKIDL
jgi:hypothetical protein